MSVGVRTVDLYPILTLTARIPDVLRRAVPLQLSRRALEEHLHTHEYYIHTQPFIAVHFHKKKTIELHTICTAVSYIQRSRRALEEHLHIIYGE